MNSIKSSIKKKNLAKLLLALHGTASLFSILLWTTQLNAKTSYVEPSQTDQKKNRRQYVYYWKTTTNVPVYFIRTSGKPLFDILVKFKAGSAYEGSRYGLAKEVHEINMLSFNDKKTSQLGGLIFSSGLGLYESFYYLKGSLLDSSLAFIKHDFPQAFKLDKALLSESAFERLKCLNLAAMDWNNIKKQEAIIT